MSTKYTPAEQLKRWAESYPNVIAATCVAQDGSKRTLTYQELESWSNRLARRLSQAGVKKGSFVPIILPNCLEHIVAAQATWKLGGCPTPISVKMPAAERDQLLDLAQGAAVVGDIEELDSINIEELHKLEDFDDSALPVVVPSPMKAIGSGGSTGKSKLIVSNSPFAYSLDNPALQIAGYREGNLLYSPGPLYHNQPFSCTHQMLFLGGRVMINERFDAQSCLELIQNHRPEVLNLVPTMMQRMLRVSGVENYDLSGVRALWHMAAPCPDWVKRGWINLIGAEKVFELWGATENVGFTTILGTEWLERPGSVGKGVFTQFKILDEDGKELPPGEVGEIYSSMGMPPTYSYKGSEPAKVLEGDFVSVGDMGYLDEDGYLYLADRRVDMIISGGANIFPAEVEGVLSEHPRVADLAVVGLKDEGLGRRVHAIIEPYDFDNPPHECELDAMVRERLSSYKVPRSYEFLEKLPRDESGKIRRQALRDERDGQAT